MRRKDGQPKRRARRTKPEFKTGFAENPATATVRHRCWAGARTQGHYSVLSLFAGCGGLDLGLTGGFNYLGRTYDCLPFDVVGAIDNSEDAVETYRLNLGQHADLLDLSAISPEALPPVDVLTGGFPCQDFSSSGPKTGLDGRRGQLYRVLVEYMECHRPSVVIGENVPHLARLSGGKYLETILSDLQAVGYEFEVWELYGPEYGLPQSRRRLFLIGVRDDMQGFPQPPDPTHAGSYVTTSQALGDLQGVDDESVTNQSQYYVASRASAGGGQGDHTNPADGVAYCIRANARGRIQVHYSLDRRLTVRECARLQGFPDEFVFPFTTQRNLTLIGNAVPPMLGHHVGGAVAHFLGASKEERARLSELREQRSGAGSQLDLFGGSP